MLQVTDLTKDYPTPRGPLRVLSDVSFELGARRRRRDHGAVGQRQELAALHPRRARAADVRHRDARRPQSVPAERRASSRRSATADRVRVPGSLPAAAVHGARERADPDAGRAGRTAPSERRPSARAQLVEQVGLARSHRSSPGRALRRRAAARRDRARARAAAAPAAVRRADRQPRSRRRRQRRVAAARSAPPAEHHPHRRHPQRAARGEAADPVRLPSTAPLHRA